MLVTRSCKNLKLYILSCLASQPSSWSWLVTGGVNVAFIALQSFSVSTYYHTRKAVVTPTLLLFRYYCSIIELSIFLYQTIDLAKSQGLPVSSPW